MKKIIPLFVLLLTLFSCKEVSKEAKQLAQAQAPVKLVERKQDWYPGQKFSVSPLLNNGLFVLNLQYDNGKTFEDTIEVYYDDKNETADIYREIANHKADDFILTTSGGEVMNISTTGTMKSHYWYNDSMSNLIYVVGQPVRNYHPD